MKTYMARDYDTHQPEVMYHFDNEDPRLNQLATELYRLQGLVAVKIALTLNGNIYRELFGAGAAVEFKDGSNRGTQRTIQPKNRTVNYSAHNKFHTRMDLIILETFNALGRVPKTPNDVCQVAIIGERKGKNPWVFPGEVIIADYTSEDDFLSKYGEALELFSDFH